MLGVTLTQSTTASAIETDLTLVATVLWSGSEPAAPPGGWNVVFTGTGDGGWTSGSVLVGADGEARYTRSSPVAQTETITARIANRGCGLTSNR